MPTYDYQCDDCGLSFESFHTMTAPQPACRRCGGRTKRIFVTAPAIHGAMARGREEATRALPQCGAGCRCCP